MPVLGLGLATRAGLPWLPTEEFGANLKAWIRPDELTNPNLCRYSSEFDQLGWSTSNASVVVQPTEANPIGIVDGKVWKLTAAATNGEVRQIDTTQDHQDIELTHSIYFKQAPGHNGTSHVRLATYDGQSGLAGDPVVPGVEWTRYELPYTQHADASRTQMRVYADLTTGTQSVLIWGGQIERGSSASSYHPNDGATRAGLLTLWPDQSGNGNDAVQETQAYMALIAANQLDGWAVADHDDIDDAVTFIETAQAVDPSGPFGVFFVLRTHDAGDAHESISMANFGGNTYIDMRAGGGIRIVTVGDIVTLSTAGHFVPDTNYYVAVLRAANGDMHTYKNGVEITAAGTPNCGGDYGVATPFRRGPAMVDGYEFMFVDRVVTSGELAKVDAYMSLKYPSLGI